MEDDKNNKKDKMLPEEWFCAVLITVMLVICFFNVVTRYCFNYSNTVLSVALDCLFPWITFIGAIITCDYGMNTAFTLLADSLPRKARSVVEFFNLAVAVALFGALLYYGMEKVISYYNYHTMVTSMPLIPKWIWSLCTPLGSLGCIVRLIQVYIRHLREQRFIDAAEDATAKEVKAQ